MGRVGIRSDPVRGEVESRPGAKGRGDDPTHQLLVGNGASLVVVEFVKDLTVRHALEDGDWLALALQTEQSRHRDVHTQERH